MASIFPAGAPSQVYIVPVPREITEDRVTLTWTAPKDNGGVITEYTVYQRKVNGSPSDWERKPTGLHSLQHEIVGLERGKMYEFQVTATNRYGESLKGEDATRGVRVLGKALKCGFKLKLNEIRLRIFYIHESALYGMGKGCGKILCSAETADDARTSFFFFSRLKM